MTEEETIRKLQKVTFEEIYSDADAGNNWALDRVYRGWTLNEFYTEWYARTVGDTLEKLHNDYSSIVERG